MNIRLLVFFIAMPSILFSSCKTAEPPFESELLAADTKTKRACLSFEGNGIYFASHIGTLIAFYEQGYRAAISSGGSSGAIIAATASALEMNPSLQRSGYFPHQAAKVLAASTPIINSVLFLPNINRPLRMVDALDIFLSGSSEGILASDSENGLAHLESIVGQSALIVEFFRTFDFSRALSLSFNDRQLAISNGWKNFTGAIIVSPDELADAMFLSEKELIAQGAEKEITIQKRLFELFKGDRSSYYRSIEGQREQWNQFAEANAKLFGFKDRETRRKTFKRLVSAIRAGEDFASVAGTIGHPFILPDPKIVYRAFLGRGPSGQALELPNGFLLHSTARRTSSSGRTEMAGLSHLYQIYYPSRDLYSEAVGLRSSGLSPFENGEFSVIPNSRILVSNASLPEALSISVGEPTGFSRRAAPLDGRARALIKDDSLGTSLMGYGGWLEKSTISTLSRFRSCAPQNVDFFVSSVGAEKMSSFPKMALAGVYSSNPYRGALEKLVSQPSEFSRLFSGQTAAGATLKPEDKIEFEKALRSAEGAAAKSLSMSASMGRVNVVYDLKTVTAAGSNNAIKQIMQADRRALILSSYIHASRQFGGQSKLPDLWASSDLAPINQITEAGVLRESVEKALPRPTLK